MITKYTNQEITNQIKDLNNSKFIKDRILGTYCSKTIYLKCNWLGHEYTENVYLEKLNMGKTAVCVGLYMYPFTDEGIERAVEAINNN
jgi:hypothetical protein